jgi:hypothetical protein
MAYTSDLTVKNKQQKNKKNKQSFFFIKKPGAVKKINRLLDNFLSG